MLRYLCGCRVNPLSVMDRHGLRMQLVGGSPLFYDQITGSYSAQIEDKTGMEPRFLLPCDPWFRQF